MSVVPVSTLWHRVLPFVVQPNWGQICLTRARLLRVCSIHAVHVPKNVQYLVVVPANKYYAVTAVFIEKIKFNNDHCNGWYVP
jgi:hypothetical protein